MVSTAIPEVLAAAVPGPAPVKKSESAELSFYYGDFQALKSINMPIYEKKVTALIGPSGCGKSTYLRCFNRMHDLYPGNRYQGRIMLYPDNTDILNPEVDPIEVRMRISMVFQKPNPFPKTIYENVAYGLRVRGERKRPNKITLGFEPSLPAACCWLPQMDNSLIITRSQVFPIRRKRHRDHLGFVDI